MKPPKIRKPGYYRVLTWAGWVLLYWDGFNFTTITYGELHDSEVLQVLEIPINIRPPWWCRLWSWLMLTKADALVLLAIFLFYIILEIFNLQPWK